MANQIEKIITSNIYSSIFKRSFKEPIKLKVDKISKDITIKENFMRNNVTDLPNTRWKGE